VIDGGRSKDGTVVSPIDSDGRSKERLLVSVVVGIFSLFVVIATSCIGDISGDIVVSTTVSCCTSV
jgi:hypothetical protein